MEGLRWERRGDLPEFRLVSRAEELGTFEFVNKKRVVAAGGTESGSWEFVRQKHLHIEFSVRESRSHAPVATLTLPFRKPGVLAFVHGSRFLLSPGRNRNEPWRIADERNAEMVRIQPVRAKRQRFEYLSGADIVVSPGAWRLGELDLLILAGWFSLSWMALIQEAVAQLNG